MDKDSAVIYGLEFQARALCAQLAETEKIKFIIGTQSLKQTSNQIHLLEFNEELSTIKTSIVDKSENWQHGKYEVVHCSCTVKIRSQ